MEEIKQYFNELQYHDWWYLRSDSRKTVDAGIASYKYLENRSKESDIFRKMFDDFKKFYLGNGTLKPELTHYTW